jgi:hypothetical protein
MPRNELSHLKHAHLLLATNNYLQCVIGIDQSPLLLVSELVFLDVIPARINPDMGASLTP